VEALTLVSSVYKMSTPDIDRLGLSDSDNEDLFASPSKASKPIKVPESKATESNNAHQQRSGESKYDAEQAREDSLRKELESVRSINDIIEGVVSSLECAQGNMGVCISNHDFIALS
jgi:hypothetical protein